MVPARQRVVVHLQRPLTRMFHALARSAGLPVCVTARCQNRLNGLSRKSRIPILSLARFPMRPSPTMPRLIRWCGAVLLLAGHRRRHGGARIQLVLVKEGKARAVIVVADDANRNTTEAAAAFQKVVGQMTGVELAIRRASEFHHEAAPVFVGMSPPVRAAGTDVLQDGDGEERYVVQRGHQPHRAGGQRRGQIPRQRLRGVRPPGAPGLRLVWP